MDYIKRAQAKDIGPGGWTCRCCGPKTSRGAITVSSEPAAVADYLSSQIKKQIQED